MDDEHAPRILKLASTDRHSDEMELRSTADRYLVGSLAYHANGYEVGYRTVMLWYDSGCFDGVDIVELYVTSKISLNIGILDGFAAIGIPVRLMEYMPHNGSYRLVERRQKEVRQ